MIFSFLILIVVIGTRKIYRGLLFYNLASLNLQKECYTTIFNPRVPATNPFAAGTSQGNVLHNFLPGLIHFMPER